MYVAPCGLTLLEAENYNIESLSYRTALLA